MTAAQDGLKARRAVPPPLPTTSKASSDESVARRPASTFVAEPSCGVKRFGSLEVIGKLATGGMATVYLCRLAGEAGFQRLFAVKALHPHLASDEAFVSMLMDEARIAARLHHPHAVSISDIGVQDGAHFLVMDYIEGCSVADMLRVQRSGSALGLFVRVMVDALNGLEAAHGLVDDHERPLGLIHRDVSPQNILIGTDGNGWITDFGIAKARARITSTQPGVFKGKICYLAPELLIPPHRYDHRVDIFAAGSVLWSMLTGRKLFQGETDAATAQNILREPIPSPSSVGWHPPRCFDDICLRALARDPDDRYPSAAELASDLRAAGIEAGVMASPLEVARWVKTTFQAELDARHEAIRRLSAPDAVRSPQLSVPVIPPVSRTDDTPPEVSTSDIVLLDDDAPIVSTEMAEVVPTGEVPPAVERRRWGRLALLAAALLALLVIVPAASVSNRRVAGAAPFPAVTAAPPAPAATAPGPPAAAAAAVGQTVTVDSGVAARDPVPVKQPPPPAAQWAPQPSPPDRQAQRDEPAARPKPPPSAAASAPRPRPPAPAPAGQTVIEKNPYLK